ncbi:hypothetical protein B0H16DRAFT_1686875 [Mycena metata]|uniref:Uncharacterized protein n=1 Tax=Mycena metata TaxID=1033252 RepID=A0AAD7NN73_9AGAR|nr:hypothetical protein B0H16DRAFT_1686875 [Mycena metata]
MPTPRYEPEPAPAQQRASLPEAIWDKDPTSAALVTDNLLFSVYDGARSSFSSSVSPPPTTLLPTCTSFPSATKSTTTASALEPRMQGSTVRQREMAKQMGLMAAQLKRNALYFSDLMAKDQRVMEEMELKLEVDFGYTQETQARMKSLREKTGSSASMSMLIILVVTFLFMFVVLLIRFSGR